MKNVSIFGWPKEMTNVVEIIVVTKTTVVKTTEALAGTPM